MNVRYKELKYEGQIYNKRHQIDEILIDKGLGWVLDMELENIRMEIYQEKSKDNPTVIFNAGIIYNGTIEYAVLRGNIDVRNCLFENGVIFNCVWKNGTIEKGIILGGVFLKGDILFADIRGGDIMSGVNVSDKCEKQDIQSPQYDNGIEGQSIHENVLNFKNFLKNY